MHVGIGLPNTLKGADAKLLMEWAHRAEEGPFTSLGVFDRLVYHSFDPLTTLAVCAGATTSIQLAATVIAGPLRNAVLLAKRAATLDALSDGRFTLGLALGAREADYEAAGVPYSGRGRRFTEQLGVLRSIWEDDRIGPEPTRPGGPQLLIGGLSDRAFGRVARFADGYVHGGGPPRAFAKAATKARAAWTETGRSGEPVLWGHGYYALGEQEAEMGRDYLLDYYAFTGPFAERIAEGLLTNQQAIIQFIRGYEEAGCEELILFPTAADIEQLERLADIVS